MDNETKDLIDMGVEASVWTDPKYFNPDKLKEIHERIVKISEALPELLGIKSAYQKFVDSGTDNVEIPVTKAA